MKVTRKMVAELAGVSKESVSYVLNRSRPVSDQIVKRVMDAVEQLGYIPDTAARSLVKKTSSTIGVICNDIANPFYSEVIDGIELATNAVNYSILIGDAKPEFKSLVTSMIAHKVDGIILQAFPDQLDFDYDFLLKYEIPLLVSHNTALNNPLISHLEPDFYSGIREALEYLKELGHKQVTMLSAFDSDYPYDNRLSAYCTLHKKIFGTDCDYVNLPGNTKSTIETGEALAETLLLRDTLPTALLVFNDLMAIGAEHYFFRHGIHVPKDVSIISIDDTIFATVAMPSLTSIGYDKKKFGGKMFSMLLENIQNKHITSELFPTKLTVRDSTDMPRFTHSS